MGHLLTLRLTARGLLRPRLGGNLSSSISSRTVSWNAFLSRGGKCDPGGHFTANDPDGVEEREPVWIFIGFEGGFMHDAAHGEMSHQKSKELLLYQIL